MDYLYSRDAHNVATLRGIKHDRRSKVSVNRAKNTELYDDYIIRDEGFSGRLLERRAIYLRDPDVWIIWDTVNGAKHEDLQQLWHINSGVRVSRRDRGFELRDGTSSLVLTWLGTQPGIKFEKASQKSLVGWIATRWKTLVPASVAIATTKATDARGIAVLMSPAKTPPEQLGIISSYITTTGILDLRLAGRGKRWHIRVEEDAISIDVDSWSS